MSTPSAPPTPTVSAMVVRPVLHSLRSFGVDVSLLVERAGLSAEVLTNRALRVPVEQELSMWRIADELLGEPMLGLRIAKQFEPGVLGSLGYLLRNSENVEALVERAQRFCRLMDDLAQVGLEVEGEEARITFSRAGHYPVPPSGVECLVAVAFTTGHGMWPTARARWVAFTHKLRGELTAYEARFRCPVVFEAQRNAIAFDSAWLRAPAANADPKLGRVLEAHTEHLLAQLPKPHSFVEAAREELRAQLGSGNFTPEALGKALRVSERTLRRRLQQEGTSYQTLLDEVRHALALSLVLRTDLSLVQAAEQLGFADVSTFYRAFKRWTGTTPAQYQKQRR